MRFRQLFPMYELKGRIFGPESRFLGVHILEPSNTLLKTLFEQHL